MIRIVLYLTCAEKRAAAVAGNERAAAELPSVNWQALRWECAETLKRAATGKLLEPGSGAVRIDRGFEQRGGQGWTVLWDDGREIWRELGFRDGYQRFVDALEMRRQRHEGYLGELRPTPAIGTYLHDRLSAPRPVARLDASLLAK